MASTMQICVRAQGVCNIHTLWGDVETYMTCMNSDTPPQPNTHSNW